MGYAILRIDRIKTQKQFADSFKHNERIYQVKNADESKRHLNETLVSLEHVDYQRAYESAVSDMKSIGAQTRNIRKDAVCGFEVILRFSEEDIGHINIDAWKEANLKWLDETFNPPGHEIHYTDRNGNERTNKVDNVKSVILHMDEHVPHIHAFVVPIDEKGHLNSRYYTGGNRYGLARLQDSYARVMEPFGLKRGEVHSVARPEQLSRYYRNITKAVEATLPPVLPGESIEAYKERAEETYQAALSAHNHQIVKMNQAIIAEKSKTSEERDALKFIARDLGLDRVTGDNIKEVRDDAKEMRALKAAIADYPDRDQALEFQEMMNDLLDWARERDEKTRKLKERRYEVDK